jgi:hypothetical protein
MAHFTSINVAYRCVRARHNLVCPLASIGSQILPSWTPGRTPLHHPNAAPWLSRPQFIPATPSYNQQRQIEIP